MARNAPNFDLRQRLFGMCGVDLTRIDGIDVTTATVVTSEVGAGMSEFTSDKHFASWLGLCPDTWIAGVVANLNRRTQQLGLQVVPIAAPA